MCGGRKPTEGERNPPGITMGGRTTLETKTGRMKGPNRDREEKKVLGPDRPNLGMIHQFEG